MKLILSLSAVAAALVAALLIFSCFSNPVPSTPDSPAGESTDSRHFPGIAAAIGAVSCPKALQAQLRQLGDRHLAGSVSTLNGKRLSATTQTAGATANAIQ